MQGRSRFIGSPRCEDAGPVSMPASPLVDPLPFSSVFPRSILICRTLSLRAPSLASPLTPFGARIPTRVSALLMTSPARVHRSRREVYATLARCPRRRLRMGTPALQKASITSRFGPSSGALSLSTVCSAIGLAGLFHPPAMSRTSPVQGLLSPRSGALSSTALCPLAFRSARAHRLPGCRPHEPRLRGLFPREAAFYQQSGEASPVPAPLLGFLLLQVLRPMLAVPSSSVRSAPDVLCQGPASGPLDIVAFSVFASMSPTLCLQSADLLELSGLPISRSLERFLG